MPPKRKIIKDDSEEDENETSKPTKEKIETDPKSEETPIKSEEKPKTGKLEVKNENSVKNQTPIKNRKDRRSTSKLKNDDDVKSKVVKEEMEEDTPKKEEKKEDPKRKNSTPIKSRKNAKKSKKEESEEEEEEEEEEFEPESKKESSGEESSAQDTESEEETPKKKATSKKKAAKKETKKETTKKQTKKIKNDDESESEESEEESDYESPKKKATPKKKAAPKKETAKKETVKKQTKKIENDDSESDSKKKKGKKRKNEDEEKPKKKGRKKKDEKEGEEEEEEKYQWWKEEEGISMKRGDVKWTTLKHNGVLFPEPYKPHGVSILYDGKPVKLTPEQEEVATFYAVLRESDYYTNEIFKKNFFTDWKELLGSKHKIQELSKCDFTPIWNWHLEQKEKKTKLSKEEKKQAKEQKQKDEEKYMWAEIDGRKEKLGNFRVEPPSLFRGRGKHPLMGKLKKRIQPEDITINIGNKKDAPLPPKGHKWKEVITNNCVTWIAGWKGTFNDYKYVFFAASSSLKGKSDYLKYENARKLKEKIEEIRKDYKLDWKSEKLFDRQRGVALYFIDKLALRIGNEKGDDEADTVGCCSLRIEHIELLGDNTVKFDFLGKDSIRYVNEVKVEPLVYKNLKEFIKDKKKDENLFDQLNTSQLNDRLKEYMEKLTAKVFRTYNASVTLNQELLKENVKKISDVEKIAYYNSANKQVAILCNHQKTVSKTFDQQLQKMDDQVQELRDHIDALKKAKKTLTKKDYDTASAEWDKRQDKLEEKHKKAMEEYEKGLEKYEEEKKKGKSSTKPLKPSNFTKKPLPKKEELIDKQIENTEKKIETLTVKKRIKDDGKAVALGTSKINYCDPRISVAWCKRNEVDVKKVFPKTLIEKFPWAMDVEKDFEF